MDNVRPSRLLDTKEVAAAIGLNVKTLENWRIAGNGPRYIKVGRLVKYDIVDIEAWKNARRVNSTSEHLPAA